MDRSSRQWVASANLKPRFSKHCTSIDPKQKRQLDGGICAAQIFLSRQPSIQRSHGRQKRQSGIIPSQHHGRQREAKQDHLSAASWGTKGDRAESSQPSIQEEPWIKRDKGGHCRIILAQDCFYARIENPFLAKLLGEKLGKPNTSPKHRSY